MGESAKKFIGEFLLEVEDLRRAFYEDITHLEAHPDDMERVNSIFSTIHTLKGSALFFNLKGLAGVAVKLEDLLSYVQTKQLYMTDALMNALWEGIELIEKAIDTIKGGDASGKITSEENAYMARPAAHLLYPLKNEYKKVPAEYRKTDRVRYKDSGSDVTRQVFVVRSFLDCKKSGDACGITPEKFITMLESLVRVFERNKHDSTALIIKQMMSDYGAMSSHSGTGNAFLIDRLIKHFTAVVSTLTVIEADNLSYGNALSADAREQSKPSFRIEEEKVSDIINTVHKFAELQKGFDLVRDRLMFSNAPRDTLIELQKCLNEFNFLTHDVLQKLMKIKLTSPKRFLEKVEKLIEDLARSCKKKVGVCIEGGEVFIDRAKLEMLESILPHIVRNCIDHGIEAPAERLLLGKPENGTISIKIAIEGGVLAVSVSDDGRGISFQALKDDACKKKHITVEESLSMDEEESLRLLFMPGVTTATSVSDVSGRGMGMDYVLNIVKRAGGLIAVSSSPGQSTCFTLRFPHSIEG